MTFTHNSTGAPIKRLEIHLGDGIDDKPREVPLGQPLTNIRRQEKRLLAITCDEALAHRDMVLSPPDDTPDLRDSLRQHHQCAGLRRTRVAARASPR
jgi:hypothetical protein